MPAAVSWDMREKVVMQYQTFAMAKPKKGFNDVGGQIRNPEVELLYYVVMFAIVVIGYFMAAANERR
jgi:hypothetical protein